jgi:hypothetical protein
LARRSGGQISSRDEIRDHLMTAIDDLQRGGMDPRETEQMAIERFGAPEAILKHHEPEGGGMTLWLTRILTVLAAVTTFVAAVVAIHSLVFDDGSAAVETVKVGQSARSSSPLGSPPCDPGRRDASRAPRSWRWRRFGCWCPEPRQRRGSSTGDPEAWAVLANLMVAAQGAMLAWMAMTRSAEA